MNISVNNVDNTQNIELNRNELLRLLSLLEGKLQGNEITIAALKADRLRRLFYPTIISKKKIDKINRNSINYATIIPVNKQIKNDQIEETYDNKIDNLNESNNQNDLNENDKNFFISEEYNQYINELNTNPYLSLANDLNFADDLTTNESLIKRVHNGRVIAIKELIRVQREVKSYLENQLEIVTSELNKIKSELNEEKKKNLDFKRDETLKDLEKLSSEKKELENEVVFLNKKLEEEKEREKIMVIYLLAERKQLIIKLIEEKDYNAELHSSIAKEKQRSDELEEGLEEESKRSLQMEIDLECLTNKYEVEKTELEDKLKILEEKNLILNSECENLRKKLDELVKTNVNSNNLNNNTCYKNNVDLGEGVRSTIVTFNNAIANFAESTVVSSQRQTPTVVQSVVQSKPVLSSKPSFNKTIISNNKTNGKAAVTIINTKNSNSSFDPSRETLRNNDNSSGLKQSSTNDKNLNNQSNDNLTKNSSQNSKTTSTSVASVIQKFSNSTISNKNSNAHPPLVKKISSTGLVANIAQNITQQANRGPPPPVPPNKPILNSSLIKDRTAKIFEQSSSGN